MQLQSNHHGKALGCGSITNFLHTQHVDLMVKFKAVIDVHTQPFLIFLSNNLMSTKMNILNLRSVRTQPITQVGIGNRSDGRNDIECLF